MVTMLELCAVGEAHFYAAAYRALGIAVENDGSMWWATGSAPRFFNNAGTLTAGVPEDQVVAALTAIPGPGVLAVRDPFATLDLAPFGFRRDARETWMVRPVAPLPAAIAPVDGLEIRRARRARDIAVFERCAFANSGGLDSYVKGALHPGEATAEEPDLHLFIGRVDGEPVATALAAVHPAVVGVQALSTHPRYRRRGIARQMMVAVIAAAPDRPTALASTPMARQLYADLGFFEAGPASDWERPI
jgi:GNAT superfamily N-acetyltransferase